MLLEAVGRGFSGVRGLPHGCAGEKKVLFLRIQEVSVAALSSVSVLGCNLSARARLFGRSRTAF